MRVIMAVVGMTPPPYLVRRPATSRRLVKGVRFLHKIRAARSRGKLYRSRNYGVDLNRTRAVAPTMSNPSTQSLPEAAALSAATEAWRGLVEAELKGAPFEKKLGTRTFEGVALRPLYTRATTSERAAHFTALGRPPGAAPFLRGARAAGGRWEVAQEIAAATPEEFNLRLRSDLMAGRDCAVLVARSPVRPDGLELGGHGAIAHALAGVELAVLPVHLDAGAGAAPLGRLYLDHAAERGVPGCKLAGSLTADPYASWALAGALPGGASAGLDGLAAWTEWAAPAAPALRTVGVDARIWAEAGGTAVHELACALATTADYLRGLRERGVELETSVPRLRVAFSAGPQFLMETAKFRAWRPLLARVVVALGGDVALAGRAAMHASTACWNKSRLDPHVNLLRVTAEAFAAALGGVDSLHVAPFDAVFGAGETEGMARRIARNVHALLAEEFGATFPIDPTGGSWCVESLTDELARAAWRQFQEFERLGGFAAALRAGVPQALVAAAAKDKADAVGSRRYGLVGVNVFPKPRETLRPASASAPTAPAPVTASGDEPIKALRPFRAAEGFESLRDAAAAFAASNGSAPKAFLAKIGPVAQHKARADFATGFLLPGGFEVLAKQAFATAEEAATAAAASGAPLVVLCSTDETYPSLVPAFASALRAARPGVILALAGLPSDAAVRDAYAAAGVDLFIHVRAPLEKTLHNLFIKIGVLS
jgi:methylmalonyl-CoA mutase